MSDKESIVEDEENCDEAGAVCCDECGRLEWIKQRCRTTVEYEWTIGNFNSGPNDTRTGFGDDEDCTWVCPYCDQDLGLKGQTAANTVMYGKDFG